MDETLIKKKKLSSTDDGSENSSLQDSGIDIASTDGPTVESDTEMIDLVKGEEKQRTVDQQPLLMAESDLDTDGTIISYKINIFCA